MKCITNPIIPGNFPDPSICRVGEDYYIVCSSFELFPGLPVFHSRDLANWEMIGCAVGQSNHIDVTAWSCVGSVMAPTIRYHNGTFYIINANMSRGVNCNYIITAQDPAGPWSEPVYLPDVPNIDASIFFDEDGTCCVIGTGLTARTPAGSTERCIWAAELDLQTMKIRGEITPIWDSALRGASSPEAPHIYKKDGWYYLLIAEGGTEHNHSITVARSRERFGWYEGHPGNPILTHRHLGSLYPVGNVGHGDLFQTSGGDWYCVMLGSRLVDGFHKNLGRESFICPVIWENGWPVLCPGEGKLSEHYPTPDGLWHPFPAPPVREHFDRAELDPRWVFWGTPTRPFHRIGQSRLYLRCLPRPLDMPILPLRPDRTAEDCFRANVSGLFLRQTHLDADVAARMEFTPSGGEQAGLVMVQAMNHSLRVERALCDGVPVVRAVLSETDFRLPPFIPGYDGTTVSHTLAQVRWDGPEVVFALRIRRQRCEVLFGAAEDDLALLCEVDLTRINPSRIAGFSGPLLGLYATGNGTDSPNEAAFDWMDYRPI